MHLTNYYYIIKFYNVKGFLKKNFVKINENCRRMSN